MAVLAANGCKAYLAPPFIFVYWMRSHTLTGRTDLIIAGAVTWGVQTPESKPSQPRVHSHVAYRDTLLKPNVEQFNSSQTTHNEIIIPRLSLRASVPVTRDPK
jgi:hypothetical protein